MTEEQAKEVLRAKGYFVDNLWHVDDVKLRWNCTDDEVAQDVLNRPNFLTFIFLFGVCWF